MALKDRQGKSDEQALKEEMGHRKGSRELHRKLDRFYDTVAEERLRETSNHSYKAPQPVARKEAPLHQIANMGRKKDYALALVTDETLAAFSGKLLRGRCDPRRGLGKEDARGLISKIEVADDEIRIQGSDNILLAGFAARKGDSPLSGEVLSYFQGWWPGRSL